MTNLHPESYRAGLEAAAKVCELYNTELTEYTDAGCKLAAIVRALPVPETIAKTYHSAAVRYCDICDIAECATHRPVPESKQPSVEDVAINALRSISNNSCCDNCQEAKLVAKAAMRACGVKVEG